MTPWLFPLLLGLALCGLASRGFAQPALAASPDTKVRFETVTSKWVVQTNGTWIVEAEVTIRPPKENPSHIVRVPLTWSGSTEKLTVVAARIDGPNGRSVSVPPDHIREDPPHGDRYFHEFSDQKRLVITFTDVGPDDAIVVRTKRDVFRPRVPGGFMAAPVLDRTVGWEETNYTISVPSTLPLKVETRGFKHQIEVIIDRTMHYLHAPKIVAPARDINVLSQFDRFPRFAASTFLDWNEFAKAYATVLVPHAAVTPAIKAMAEKLTAGVKDPPEQARRLYDWVRDNVRYIPIPIEESRPDPHDAETVMSNLYGDAKDHAVLLRALLAARDIRSAFVLLNASDSATLAGTPNIRPMNHMILYVPRLGVYLDTTLGIAPFGVLAFGEIGKPAIHIGGDEPGRHQIPIPSSGETQSDFRTDAILGEDGEVTGTTTATARGAFAVWLRSAARSFGQANPAAGASLLRQHGTPGQGVFSFDPTPATTPEFTVRGTFHLQNQSALLSGGFFAPWTGLRILPRPGDFLVGPVAMGAEGRNIPTFCYRGIQNEELVLTIPASRELGSLPPDTSIDTDLVRFRSRWRLEGRKLTVTREFQSLTPGPLCEGSVRWAMVEVLAKIRTDLSNPVGLRQDKIDAVLPPRREDPGRK
ncbi:MAG: DUF3857 domain-containing protein [Acetobacteraceae bacterium]|nr:DUF3857 domain-containing protein [Acetobacteraceae bacterium]